MNYAICLVVIVTTQNKQEHDKFGDKINPQKPT